MKPWLDKLRLDDGRSKIRALKARRNLYKVLGKFAIRTIPIRVAIEGMRDRAKGHVKLAFEDIHSQMMNGTPFSRAVSFLPTDEQVLIAAAENSDTLAEGFEQAAFIAQAKRRMQNSLLSLIGPAILISMALAEVVFLLPVVFPTLEQMQSVDQWPTHAQYMKAFSDFLQANLNTILVLSGVFITLAMVSLKRWTGKKTGTRKLRLWLDHHLPPWNIYRTTQASSFMLALGSIMRTNNKISDALQLMRRTASPWLSAHLDQMIYDYHNKEFKTGQDLQLAPILDTGLLDAPTMGLLYDFDAAGSAAEEIQDMGEEILSDTLDRIDGITKTAQKIGLVLAMGLAAAILLTLFITAIEAVDLKGVGI